MGVPTTSTHFGRNTRKREESFHVFLQAPHSKEILREHWRSLRRQTTLLGLCPPFRSRSPMWYRRGLSILGPVLFNLNDLSKVIKYCEMESYVDDTKLYLSIYQQRNNTVLRNELYIYIHIYRSSMKRALD